MCYVVTKRPGDITVDTVPKYILTKTFIILKIISIKFHVEKNYYSYNRRETLLIWKQFLNGRVSMLHPIMHEQKTPGQERDGIQLRTVLKIIQK